MQVVDRAVALFGGVAGGDLDAAAPHVVAADPDAAADQRRLDVGDEADPGEFDQLGAGEQLGVVAADLRPADVRISTWLARAACSSSGTVAAVSAVSAVRRNRSARATRTPVGQ
jgi:hypothetical protein